MQTANDIRKTFLDYFSREGHEIVASSPLVPRNDPTLMFTNAGMVQFKNVFTGAEKRDYVRAATSQKCVRAGGKHNDLENVGHTARHHTFFEMLGNFSFGDYFKEHAIELAWRLITKEFGLPKNRLMVTVYHEDDEAFNLWRKISGLSESSIIRISTADNFWSMGDTGPCGPCSEIFYDHGDKIAGGPPGSPDQDGDRFVEIWNLVFMQFEQLAGGERINLPRPSIDTGMGLERLAAVLQGKHDNYDTDQMRALIEASAHLTGVDPDGEFKTAHRVIADHLRSSSFLIADGVTPDNEGRGYVLRRIMRRAMRHIHKLTPDAMMHRLVPPLVDGMGEAYPELTRAQALITETLKLEETRFKQMLERGLKLLDGEIGKIDATQSLPGEVAFKLYDTYGFPLDMTEDILRDRNITLDKAGFDTAMAAQKKRASEAGAGIGEAATDAVWFQLREKHGATNFRGYDSDNASGHILAIVKDGKQVESAAPGDDIAVIVDETCFYGESGGQVGDTGVMLLDGAAKIIVTDTQKKLGDLIVHFGRVENSEVNVGGSGHFFIDWQRRGHLRIHHSATHLLHEALRQHLGEHVTQKGSLVQPDRLRFDFSHSQALSLADIAAVENEVNERIRWNHEVKTTYETPEGAIDSGARALFGEKYGEEVRVVSMGGEAFFEERPYSFELCGGTHVRRSGDIGLFKIVHEGAVGSGVRRIEAVAGLAAEHYVADQQRILRDTAAAMKTLPADLPDRVATLLAEKKKLEQDLIAARKAAVLGVNSSQGFIPTVRFVGTTPFTSQILHGVPAKELRPLVDNIKDRIGSGIVVLTSDDGGKASLIVGITNDLLAWFNAVELAKIGTQALGGNGAGGRKDLAQGGGPDAGKAAEAIVAIERKILSL